MRQVTWSQRLIALMLISIGIAIPLAWVVGGYLQYPLTEMIGFRVADGWCGRGEEAFGRHCFSDFSVIADMLSAPSLWEPTSGTATAYPPSGWLIPFGIFAAAGLLQGLPFATFIFLVVALSSTLVPALWAAQGSWFSRAPVTVLTIGLGAAPVLIVLDRGNSTALIVVPLMIFAIGLIRDKSSLLILGVLVSTLLKPQMILLVVALLALRRFRYATLSVSLSVLGILASFAFWPGDRVQNFTNWIRNLVGYSDYGLFDVPYPYNLSATRSLLTISDLLGVSNLLGEENRAHLVNLLTRFSFLPGLLVLVAAVLVVLIRASRVDAVTALFIAVALIIVVPGTSFTYYLVLLIPVAALILRDPRQESTVDGTSDQWRGVLDDASVSRAPGSQMRSWAIVTVLVISFSLWAIPVTQSHLASFPLTDPVGLIQILWGPVVLLGLAAVVVSLMLPVRSRGAGQAQIPLSAGDEISPDR